MTVFYIEPSNLEKILHQNGAEEPMDFYEGVLLDNYLYFTKHGGIMAIYEHYLNCWSSDYIVYFSKDKDEINALWDIFNARMKAHDEEMSA